MEVWNSARLFAQIENVRSKNRLDTEGQLLYILNPFIASLGYDIYDISKVDTQVQSGRMIVQAHEEVKIIFSVTSVVPKQGGNIHVTIDAKRNVMELRLFAMGVWELVEQIDLSKSQEEVGETYANIIRIISLESCQIMYAERGKRMFTEHILARKLASGDMQNEFLIAAIKQLLNHPTDALITCIAEILAEEFSTDSVYNLHNQLLPLKEVGLRKLVSRYLQDANLPNEEVAPIQPKNEPVYTTMWGNSALASNAVTNIATEPLKTVQEVPSEVETIKPTTNPVVAEKAEETPLNAFQQQSVSPANEPIKTEETENVVVEPVQNEPTPTEQEEEEVKIPSQDTVPSKPKVGSIDSLFGTAPTRKIPQTKGL